jgi:glycosyltransferase involved in cell wall biosynthesis
VRDRHVVHGVAAPEQAVTIRHGAEPGSRRVRRPQPGRLRIGYLGALSAHKGVPTLLHVATRMPARWTLAIAGAGPLEAAVRAAAARDARIVPHGELDAAGRDAFLDGLDLLVIPSEWEEPATLVAVEAAVRGLPIVVSDRGGLPETPYAGIFPAGDAAALLAVLHELASDPEELARCSQVLLEANETFAWATHLDRVERQLARAAERG